MRRPGRWRQDSPGAVAGGGLLLAAAVAVALVLDLGRAHLWEPGEGRYAQTVREMMLRGTWATPTLNFEPYVDKPPGYYWLVAAAFTAFGLSEWAARLPSAVAGVLTVALTVGWTWRRYGALVALGAGGVLVTTVQFVVLARTVRMDMVLTLILCATLFYAHRLWEGRGDARALGGPAAPTWPLYLLPALGMLVKGPIAVLLPVLIVGAVTVVTGEYARLRRLRPGPGLLVAIGAASVWYVTVAVTAPDYLVAFLWTQNVGRFVDASSGHHEPFWFYFWTLPVTFLPWSVVLPGALRRAFRRARRGADREVFLLAWVVVPFVFFTLSSAKLTTYLLPLFPPLAVLVASYLATVLRSPVATQRRALRWPALGWAAGITLIAVAAPLAALVAFRDYVAHAGAALLLLPLAALGWRAIRRERWTAVPALVGVTALVFHALFYRVGAPAVNDFVGLRPAAEAARALLDAPAYAYKTRAHSFTFYDGRMLTRLVSPEAAARVLAAPAPAVLLTKAKYLGRIRPHLTADACVWWRGASGRLLLVNRPQPGAPTGLVVPPLDPARPEPDRAIVERPCEREPAA